MTEILEQIKEDDTLWQELKPLIPPNKHYSNDLHFVNSILNLLAEKRNWEEGNRFITSLNWQHINPPKFKNAYNRRFNRWRANGVWEQMLCVLVKYEKFAWLSNPFIYTLLMSDYEFFTSLNKIYLHQLGGVFNDALSAEESKFLRFEAHPKFFKNRERRQKYSSTRHRGAYMCKYSEEEQQEFADLEDIIT